MKDGDLDADDVALRIDLYVPKLELILRAAPRNHRGRKLRAMHGRTIPHASRAILCTYERLMVGRILTDMEQAPNENALLSGVEVVKGCPICEHSDPQLERDLQEFAQMLFEVMLADQKKQRKSSDT